MRHESQRSDKLQVLGWVGDSIARTPCYRPDGMEKGTSVITSGGTSGSNGHISPGAHIGKVVPLVLLPCGKIPSVPDSSLGCPPRSSEVWVETT